MADNCGECLALDPKFNCGWCKTSGQCEVRDSCGAPGWLDRDQPCPDPQVSRLRHLPGGGDLCVT